MVRVDRFFSCETCGKEHWTYEEAQECEADHILENAIKKLGDDIRAIRATPNNDLPTGNDGGRG